MPDIPREPMKPQKYYAMLTRALREEMDADETVVLIGEDVGPSGGIFAQTRGLFNRFGANRVRDMPVAEAGFVSMATGAAATGLRPVVEIGFEDFLTACMDGIVNQAAKLRYMLGGQVKVPLTIYCFGGGGVQAGPQHSQSLAAWFMGVPGLKVVMPATPRDVLGLTKAAIRDDNPVLVLLSKQLIGSTGPVEADGYEVLVPLGQAEVARAGTDVTIVAIGTMRAVALGAAATLAEGGIEAEVVDPRSLSPLDHATIHASLARTRHLIVAHEAHGPCGPGAEIVARATEAGIALAAPPVRLTPPFAPSPFAPSLEREYRPSAERVVAAATQMLRRA